MSESPSSGDLELIMREIQALDAENYVMNEAYATIEASMTSQKGQGEQGDAATPSAGIKVCVLFPMRSDHMNADGYLSMQARRKQEKQNIPTTLILAKRNQLSQQLLDKQKNDIQKLKQKTDKVFKYRCSFIKGTCA